MLSYGGDSFTPPRAAAHSTALADSAEAALAAAEEKALRDFADLPVEDDLHVVGPADVEVVCGQRFEECAGMPRGGEGDGLGDLDLAHGDVPPVAGIAVGAGERERQACPPAIGEHPDLAGAEPITDLLQRGRIVAGGEPVGQFFERQGRLELVIKPRQDHVLSGLSFRLAMGTATRDASEC